MKIAFKHGASKNIGPIVYLKFKFGSSGTDILLNFEVRNNVTF